MYVCMYVCMHACMYACMYVCTYEYTYIHAYIHIYVRIVRTHIHKNARARAHTHTHDVYDSSLEQDPQAQPDDTVSGTESLPLRSTQVGNWQSFSESDCISGACSVAGNMSVSRQARKWSRGVCVCACVRVHERVRMCVCLHVCVCVHS